jgi:SAM-dependent methyltransferase
MNTTEPSVELLWSALTGYQRTAALKAAIDLDVFTAIGEGTTTAAALASRCGASARGIRVLCDHLAMDGFLARAGDGYALTATAAAFLDRHSPACLGSAVHFLTAPAVAQGFERLTEAVRRGGTAIPAEGVLAPEHPAWVEFARAMAPVAGLTAMRLAGDLDLGRGERCRVLDVAAGHGLFGITLARDDARVHVTALDWGNVLAVASENAAAAGLGDRFRTIVGSAFDVDWGRDYDLVLLPNFLHHFDVAGCVRLLEKAAAALAPGGRVVLVEFVPDEDRRAPADAVRFALVMLAGTPGGDAYTMAEYRDMLARAGFADPELLDLAPSPQRALVARRR